MAEWLSRFFLQKKNEVLVQSKKHKSEGGITNISKTVVHDKSERGPIEGPIIPAYADKSEGSYRDL